MDEDKEKTMENASSADKEDSLKDLLKPIALENYNTSSAKPNALRTDVMNKNLFRALKKELKEVFESYLTLSKQSLKRNKSNYVSLIRKFVQNLPYKKHVEREKADDFSVQILGDYACVLINPNTAKKFKSEILDLEMANEVNSILYSYTHKVFYGLIQKIEVQTLFR